MSMAGLTGLVLARTICPMISSNLHMLIDQRIEYLVDTILNAPEIDYDNIQLDFVPLIGTEITTLANLLDKHTLEEPYVGTTEIHNIFVFRARVQFLRNHGEQLLNNSRYWLNSYIIKDSLKLLRDLRKAFAKQLQLQGHHQLIDLPDQDPIIHLAIDPADGRIDFDRQRNQSTQERLELILPGVWRVAEEALYILGTGNSPYGFMSEALRAYVAETKRPASEIDFGILHMLSRQLQTSLDKAVFKHKDPEFPDLPDNAEIKIETVLDLHSTLMAASDVGERLIVSTERYNETAKDMRAMAKSIVKLQKAVAESEHIFKDGTKELIIKGLNPGVGDRDIKQRLIARGLAKNIGIVAIYGAFAVSVSYIAPLAAPIFLLKKPSGVDGALSELSQNGRDGLKRMKAFTIRHKDILRTTTTLNDGGRWFDRIMTKVISEPAIKDRLVFKEEALDENMPRARGRHTPRVIIFEPNEIRLNLIIKNLRAALDDIDLEHVIVRRGDLDIKFKNLQYDSLIIANAKIVTEIFADQGPDFRAYLEASDADQIVYMEDLSHYPFTAEEPPNVALYAVDMDSSSRWKSLFDSHITNNADLWQAFFKLRSKYNDALPLKKN